MKIVIAGPGCPRCQATEKNVFNACAQLAIDADVSHIYDSNIYSKLGVKVTPSVIVDGKIIISGKIPSVNELKRIFSALRRE